MTSMASAPPEDLRGRLEEDVGALAAMDRRTTSSGERSSADLLADRLREIGAEEVRIASFRAQSTWAWASGAHMLVGLIATRLSGPRRALLALAALISLELDVSGRSQWLRRLLPGREGRTVIAKVPAAGERRRTLILVAHHDAAHGGLLWHPAVIELNRRRSARTGRTLPSHMPAVLGLIAAAGTAKAARAFARAVLGLGLIAGIQAARSPTAPGANDNATGVAAVLELARRFVETPLNGVEVVLLFPGGEEIGAVGMYQWLRANRDKIDPSSTLVVGLDAIGSGGHLVVPTRDGLTGWFDAADIDLAERAAEKAGIPAPKRVTFPNATDASVARRSGLRAISILSYDQGWIRNLHLPSDVPENVEWNTVNDAILLTESMAEAWADQPPG
jgi:hypothetical protein